MTGTLPRRRPLRPHGRLRLIIAAIGLATLLPLLAACAPTVSLPTAPHQTATGCAAVVVRLPAVLGTSAKRLTDQQGTAAWGTGNPPSVVLRCGVTPPGATTDECLPMPVDGVDWIERAVPGTQQYVVTTFGRTPAVQLVIDTARIGSSTALPPISDAIAAAIPTQTAHCVAPAQPAPGATPTPAPTP